MKEYNRKWEVNRYSSRKSFTQYCERCGGKMLEYHRFDEDDINGNRPKTYWKCTKCGRIDYDYIPF